MSGRLQDQEELVKVLFTCATYPLFASVMLKYKLHKQKKTLVGLSPHFCVDQVRFLVRIGKSCNLSKIVSVLLSASVERVGVSRMQDFFYFKIYKFLHYCNKEWYHYVYDFFLSSQISLLKHTKWMPCEFKKIFVGFLTVYNSIGRK